MKLQIYSKVSLLKFQIFNLNFYFLYKFLIFYGRFDAYDTYDYLEEDPVGQVSKDSLSFSIDIIYYIIKSIQYIRINL